MPRHTSTFLLVFLAILTTPIIPAFANDAAFGGQGSDLIPLKETKIRMAAEDIRMTLKGSEWYVNATYTFENPTNTSVTLQMGFPEMHCNPDEGDCMEGAGIFADLVTKVRGKRVKQRTGTVSPKNTWAPKLGKVYLYTVTFAPKETVTIHHTYHHPTNEGVDGYWIDYVTRTGSLWNGPIGKARFTVQTPKRPWKAAFPASFVLQSYVERPGKTPGQGMTEFVFEMKNWTPTTDFVLDMSNYMAGGLDCPSLGLLHPEGEDEDPKKIFRDRSAQDLRHCRNLPYAFHGYTFKDKALNTHFYKPPKTYKGYGKHEDASAAESWTRIGLSPNSEYTPKLLNPKEHKYIKHLKTEEARRK